MDPVRDIGGPEKSAGSKVMDEQKKVKLQKAARDFEALFVSYMLKSMRSSIPKSEVLGDGFGGEMMESLFDTELSRELSRSNSLGVGEMLYRKLTGESLPAAKTVAPRTAAKPAGPAVPPAPVSKAAPPAATTPPEQPRSDPVRFAIGPTIAERINTYAPYIREAAEQHGVDENLLKAVMASESGGDPRAHSPADAKGLMQLIDSTAQAMGVRNVWNPRENILGGAKYLQQMLNKFKGNVEHAVASYNAGPAAVERHGGIPPFRETKAYVVKVMSFLKVFSEQQEKDDDQN